MTSPLIGSALYWNTCPLLDQEILFIQPFFLAECGNVQFPKLFHLMKCYWSCPWHLILVSRPYLRASQLESWVRTMFWARSVEITSCSLANWPALKSAPNCSRGLGSTSSKYTDEQKHRTRKITSWHVKQYEHEQRDIFKVIFTLEARNTLLNQFRSYCNALTIFSAPHSSSTFL